MKLLIPLWAVISLWYGQWICLTRYNQTAPIRFAFLEALLLGTFSIILLTEGLSYFSLLNETALTIAWGILALLTTAWGLYQHVQGEAVKLYDYGLTSIERLLLYTTCIILCLTLLTGLLYPPNNFDSLTYHMGRIAHWMQQHNVEPFATHIERQIYQPPLAEWLILQTFVLSVSDLWANSVQWLAGIGCLAGLSVLSQLMGGNRLVQMATVFMAVTTPMFILQLSSTQNDLVVSFYLINLAVYLLRYYQTRKLSNLLWAGISLGFAFLTKGTAYLFSAPILLVWAILEVHYWINKYTKPTIRIGTLPKLIVPVVLIGAISILLNTGHYARNVHTYANPLANAQEQALYTNQIHSGTMMVSNVSRNLALHFGFPGFHWAAEHSVKALHHWLQIDIQDQNTTYRGSSFDLPMLSNNEDNASNFLHLLWLSGSGIWLVLYARRVRRLAYFILLGMVTVTFLFFCAYLRWQPWHSRLHTSMFLLASPIGGLTLAAVMKKRRWPLWLFIASAAGFTLTNPFRPLITLPPLTQPVSFLDGRDMNYFVNGRERLKGHQLIIRLLNRQLPDSSKVGLLLGDNDFDYMWYRQVKPSAKLQHILVETPSHSLDTHPAVDYIISTRTIGDTIRYGSKIYLRVEPKEGSTAFFSPLQLVATNGLK